MPKKRKGPDSAHELNMGAEYTADEIEFIRAMDTFMKRTGKRFPTFTEVLAVAKSLGYRKNEPSQQSTYLPLSIQTFPHLEQASEYVRIRGSLPYTH